MKHPIPATLTVAAALALVASPAYGTEQPEEGVGTATVTLSWFLTDYPADGVKPTAETATWPQQAFVDDGTMVGWCQIDTGDAATLPADSFGPTLEKGEDYGWVTSWDFIPCGTAPVVPEPEPEPTPTPEVPVEPTPEVVAPPVDVPLDENPPLAILTTVEATPELASTGPVDGWLAIPALGAIVLGGIIVAAQRIRKARA